MKESTIPLSKIRPTEGPEGNILYVIGYDEEFYVHSGENHLAGTPTTMLELHVIEHDADLAAAEAQQPRNDFPRGKELNYNNMLNYLVWKATTEEAR